MSAYQGFPTFAEWRPTFDDRTTVVALNAMQAARDQYGQAALDKAVGVATRSAAVETGAIEGLYETTRGFTLSIAEMASGWDKKLHRRGAEVERHVHDALAGYEFILDAVTGQRPISPHWFRLLHETLCRSQDNYEVLTETPTGFATKRRTLPKGEYKKYSNNPTRLDDQVFHYCPPEMVASEMDRLADELNDQQFFGAPSVVQAAFAHYAFILIHPFADGNGRVARALASVYLYRSPGVPLVIFSDQRDSYLDALEQADAGDAGALVRFLDTRTIEAVQLVQASVRTKNAMDALTGALSGTDSELPAQADTGLVIQSLMGRLRELVETEVSSRVWPNELQVIVDQQGGTMALSDVEFGATSDTTIVTLSTSVREELVQVSVWLGLVQRQSGREPRFRVDNGSGHGLDLTMDEVFPRLSDFNAARIRTWVGSVLDEAVARLADSIRTARAVAGERTRSQN